MCRTAALAMGLMWAAVGAVRADEPRPVPLTRPEMKQLLEEMKVRHPRIPLPELTAEEKAKLGERESGYESRLRKLYLPPGEGFGFGGGNRTAAAGTPKGGASGDLKGSASAGSGAGGGIRRNLDPNMSLDYAFKTELFWIVSRTNNCQYCLGHQESKLLSAGLKEEEIAALDGDWVGFTPAQRAAFAFARKLTYEPHKLNDADIDGLRKFYKDLQILEMILSVAGNNAINRWKEGAGIPQSKDGGNFGRRTESGAVAPPAPDQPAPIQTYLTPTPEQFKAVISKVAPIQYDKDSGEPSRLTVCERPALESTKELEQALAACRNREPRLPLLDEAKAREVLSENWPDGPMPQWVRLLANFPRDGVTRVASLRAADEKGELKPLLKAQVSWIIARQDRAWYAVGQAKRRLEQLGQSQEQIANLDSDWSGFTKAEQALFTVARKLAASPVVLTDEDVANAVKLSSPRDVVELINYTTHRASFDRITESAGLQLEE